MERANWHVLDCDVEVLTKLVKIYAGDNVRVEELWDLNLKQFEQLSPVHGLILLYKWEPFGQPCCFPLLTDEDRLKEIFFFQQVINEACVTQALVSVLLNCAHSDVRLNDALSMYKDIYWDFDPVLKGLALSNNDDLRSAHNSLVKPNSVAARNSITEENVYHYATYVPIDGHLYEMNAQKGAPIDLGRVKPNVSWIKLAKSVIEDRIKIYQEHDIPYNVVAVISDRKAKYLNQIEEIKSKISGPNAGSSSSSELMDSMKYLCTLVEEETKLRERYKTENTRRKFNYLPFITEMLKIIEHEKLYLQVPGEENLSTSSSASSSASLSKHN